jgi:sarcosine oxidase
MVRHVAVHRQVLHWFPVIDDAGYRPGRTPTFIWTHGLDSSEQFYGFPPIDGLVKVAREDYAGPFDVNGISREADPADGAAMAARHVSGRLAGLSELPVKSAICPYAVTPDTDFLVETRDRTTLISACSGHGFKHSAAIGEAAAAIASGQEARVELDRFGVDRFNI